MLTCHQLTSKQVFFITGSEKKEVSTESNADEAGLPKKMGPEYVARVKTVYRNFDLMRLDPLVQLRAFVYVDRITSTMQIDELNLSYLSAFSVGAALIACKILYDNSSITPGSVSHAFGIPISQVLAAESFVFDHLLKTSFRVTEEELRQVEKQIGPMIETFSCWHTHRLHFSHANTGSPSNLVHSL